MNLKKEHSDAGNRCSVKIGSRNCTRQVHTDGPHVLRFDSGEEYLHDYNDPTQMVFGFCKTCFEPLTDVNKSKKLGCYGYCKLHDGPAADRYFELRGCKKCGFAGPHVLRNYNMTWRDGDIHCGRCGTYVRMYDAG